MRIARSAVNILISVVLIAVISGVAFLGWGKYQSATEIGVAQVSVRATAALIDRQSAMNKADTISFSEYLKKSGEANDDIDKNILALRLEKFSREGEAGAAALEFSSSAQDIIRAATMQARSKLRANIAEKNADDALAEALSSKNQYITSAAFDRSKKSRNEQVEILGEMIKRTEEMKIKRDRLLSANRKIKEILGVGEGVSLDTINSLTPRS